MSPFVTDGRDYRRARARIVRRSGRRERVRGRSRRTHTVEDARMSGACRSSRRCPLGSGIGIIAGMAGDVHAPARAVAIDPASGSFDRTADVHRALRLEWLTVAWMVVEATVAIGSGIRAHSLVLEAFGADSVIELLSAGVLLWRLHVELQRGEAFPEELERRASRFGGALLFALAAYVTGGAIRGFWVHERQEFTRAGLLLVAAA